MKGERLRKGSREGIEGMGGFVMGDFFYEVCFCFF